jgi:chromosomal replication initiation ATPase DnaA
LLPQVTAQRIKESESQLPAILRQLDRLQRTINNQEMRMEGVVIVLRDIENLLRNQQPVIIHQVSEHVGMELGCT